MKRVWVALRMCTRFSGLFMQMPGHIRIHICEELRQWRLGSFLCLRQCIHDLGRIEQLNVWWRDKQSSILKLDRHNYRNQPMNGLYTLMMQPPNLTPPGNL